MLRVNIFYRSFNLKQNSKDVIEMVVSLTHSNEPYSYNIELFNPSFKWLSELKDFEY